MPSGRKLIQEAQERGEVEFAELSDIAKRNRAYFQQFVKRGVPVELPEAVRVAIAPRLGVSPDALRESDPPAGGSAPVRDEVREAADFDPPSRGQMPRDLPVFGTAAGGNGEGAFILDTGDVVDRVRRPPNLLNNRKAYGLYVEGVSMEPAHYQGDLVIVDPAKKLRPGDRAVIVAYMPDGEAPVAFIKQIKRETADRWVVEQFNPPKELVFAKADVVSIHRILTVAEMMGI